MTTLILNWKIWNIASAVNFQYVPIQYQPLYCSVVGVFYYAGVSMIASSDDTTSVVEIKTELPTIQVETPALAKKLSGDVIEFVKEHSTLENF
jgi:hypothetical protein